MTTLSAPILVDGWMLGSHVHKSHFIELLDTQDLLFRGLKFGVGKHAGFM